MSKTIHLYRQDARYKDLHALLSKAGYQQRFIDEVYLTPNASDRAAELHGCICENDNPKLASQAFEIVHAPADSFLHSRYE